MSSARNRARWGTDDQHDAISIGTQNVGVCLVQIHHYTSNWRGCAIQTQPYSAHAFVVHGNLFLLCV